MANFRSYKTKDGAKRWLAVVRIKGFSPTREAFGNKDDAKEWAAATEKQLRDQRERGGARADVATLTLRQLARAFLDDPQTKQRKYHPELEAFLAAWCDDHGSHRLRAFGRLQIIAFRDKLLRGGLKPATANRYLSAMRRAWNWGVENFYVSGEWPQKIMLKEPKPEAILERYGTLHATIEDVHKVIEACSAASPPLGDLVGFLIGTGARLSDALAVAWRDIDRKRGDVAIRGTKTEKPLRVAMLAPGVAAIERASEIEHISGKVFWQFEDRQHAYEVFSAARKTFPEHLQRMRLHDCRHLTASLLASQGATDVELAAQLGHQSLAMVKRYSHLRGGHRGTAHEKLDEAFGVRRGEK